MKSEQVADIKSERVAGSRRNPHKTRLVRVQTAIIVHDTLSRATGTTGHVCRIWSCAFKRTVTIAPGDRYRSHLPPLVARPLLIFLEPRLKVARRLLPAWFLGSRFLSRSLFRLGFLRRPGNIGNDVPR